jgi:N-acetylglucosaminyldiphosphoundecaprenol N-acetyl-beta-D-mannosaminyltransferase
MKESIRIMGVRIDKVTLDLAVEKVHFYLQGNKTNVIYTPNTEIVMAANKDKELKNVLNQGDLVIPDGIGLIYASKIKKRELPERVTGFDLSVKILEIAAREGYSIFLLGGKKGVAKEAGEKILERFPNIKIAGSHHGYFKGAHIGFAGHEEEKKIIEEINNSNTDILFVGFGAPRQEKWIHLNKDKLKCKVIIGNGGTIDILAGRVKRAPLIYQKLGLEWFYRLVKEPWRIKRQIVLPKFVLKVLFSRNNIVE